MKSKGSGFLLLSLTAGVLFLLWSATGEARAKDAEVEAETTAKVEASANAFSIGNIPVSSSLFSSAGSAGSGGATLQIGSKYPLTFSGFLKADAFWTDSQVDNRDGPRFAATGGDDDQAFDMTVQHSRLVTEWDGPEVLYDGKVDARLEMDFFTLSQDSVSGKWNNSRIRVRQLYVNMKFDSWSFLAGQAWDLFSPHNPTSLNTNGNYWLGGNAGWRRPQFRLTKWFDVADDQRLTAMVSANANIGVEDPNGGNFNTGEDSGKPLLQFAVQYSLPFLTEGKTTVGFSALIGEEEADGIDGDITQSGYAFDLSIPITEHVTFKGEWQHGENTDSFFLGGGFDATGDEIDANAGWGQISIDATEEFTINLIAGQERISSPAAGTREQNTVYGANVTYDLAEGVVVGAEFTRFDTNYQGVSDEDSNMGWVSLIFNF